ncbi:SecDF P1 head subdomain-containing protein [Mycolicibacterium helvum]|uniref:SecDF P1 head subdomain domain-containing protein n=1 Tax=Mycolicibacterium helvum TaxID=1534349 RepID=A0A7I7T1M7_9MYCO|nr:hypothetical protein [Mycolicibacterium helvum]BBY62978.1 hypothetical protein MHEL_12210 [Mycolicibacterium helvum]
MLAVVSVLATVTPYLLRLTSSLEMQRRSATSVTPTTTTPVVTIKPLSVRPVVRSSATTPTECPVTTQTPSNQPIQACDIAKTAVYELAPEALNVDLTNVGSFRNPVSGVELVQISLTPESAKRFGQFTASQVGQQVSFVRGGTVVWAAKISAPLEGQVVQLFGGLTPEQAEQMALMLRDSS